MTIKRYIANTTQEAMNQVKADLGPDAVILGTRKIRRRGLIGLISKPLIEVTAAIDNHGYKGNKANTKAEGAITHIESKMQAMERKLGELLQGLERGFLQKGGNPPTEPFNENQHYLNILLKNEVRHQYATQIMDTALGIQKQNQVDFLASFEKAILDILGEDIKIIETSGSKQRTILFVGPTGVGKTTTLAKLAAKFAIEQNKKIGFVTADTYRIAAVDQLRVYADILDIPMNIIYSPSELPEALKEHDDRDIVFIDTAGKSIRDQDHENEISSMIELGNIDEVYLVISGSIGPESSAGIINRYRFLDDYRLLFTKMDEVTTYGTILNCRIMSQKPLSYITTGQNVPTDIEVADIHKIKNLLMGNQDL